MGIEITAEQKRLLTEGKISVDEIVKQNAELMKKEVLEEKDRIEHERTISEKVQLMLNLRKQKENTKIALLQLTTDIKNLKKMIMEMRKKYAKPSKARAKKGSPR
jgi:hypothetical protein